MSSQKTQRQKLNSYWVSNSLISFLQNIYERTVTVIPSVHLQCEIYP